MNLPTNSPDDTITLELVPRPPTMEGFPSEEMARFILATGWTGLVQAHLNIGGFGILPIQGGRM